jgi:hypothetical protein
VPAPNLRQINELPPLVPDGVHKMWLLLTHHQHAVEPNITPADFCLPYTIPSVFVYIAHRWT